MFRGLACAVAEALGLHARANGIVIVLPADPSEWEIESDVVRHS
jgi:hypothetical protein